MRLLILAILIGLGVMACQQQPARAADPRPDAIQLVARPPGDGPSVYSFADPRTGCQYLIASWATGVTITPRMRQVSGMGVANTTQDCSP